MDNPDLYKQIPLTDEILRKMGQAIVDIFAHEARRDFARRGISGKAPDGSAPIWESFSYKVNRQSIEIVSTFPLVGKMTPGPSRSYPPARPNHPVAPQRTSNGGTVLQMAPLKLKDAWVHPGIARFSFIERARRAAHEACLQILKEEAVRAVIRSPQ